MFWERVCAEHGLLLFSNALFSVRTILLLPQMRSQECCGQVIMTVCSHIVFYSDCSKQLPVLLFIWALFSAVTGRNVSCSVTQTCTPPHASMHRTTTGPWCSQVYSQWCLIVLLKIEALQTLQLDGRTGYNVWQFQQRHFLRLFLLKYLY